MNYEILKRFTSDFNIPIQIIRNEEYINYMLDLLEPTHQARTKYNALLSLIKTRFYNDPELFLKEFYRVRESIISTVKSMPAYQEFNTKDMKEYTTTSIPGVSKDGIYKANWDGHCFLSIDLKKANFQALRFAGVLEDETYEDFIRRFTDIDYIVESKYTRNVVFGQLNPGRHITVEKFIVSKIHELLGLDGLVSMVSDELIYRCDSRPDLDSIVYLVQEKFGIIVKAEWFKLKRHVILAGEKKLEYYEKEYNDGRTTLHCIPITYYPITLKLHEGKELVDFDRWFSYDGICSKFLVEFKKEIN